MTVSDLWQCFAAGSVDAQNLRERVFRALVERGSMTADECADHLGQSILSIRPRFTELSRLGIIADTGERRANRSGRMAVVWEAI